MKKTLYTFLGWNFLLFVAGLSDIVFLQRSYIGRSYGNKLDPVSTRKRHFIFDIAFNILWDAPAPFWKKFPFKTGSQSGRCR